MLSNLCGPFQNIPHLPDISRPRVVPQYCHGGVAEFDFAAPRFRRKSAKNVIGQQWNIFLSFAK